MSFEVELDPNLYFKNLGNQVLKIIQDSPGGLVVLGGGNTPKLLNKYIISILNQDQNLKNHFYNNFHFLLSDERYVPLYSVDSNYNMLRNTLFANSENPQLIPMDTTLPIDQTIENYNLVLENYKTSHKLVLSLLGIGPDGHTASLFPNQIRETTHNVVYGGKGPEGHDRISLSHQYLLESQNIIFMINSNEKKEAYIKSRNKKDQNSYPIIPFITSPKTTFYLTKE